MKKMISPSLSAALPWSFDMDVRLLFPKDYISAPFLRGQDVTLTIAKVFVDNLRTEKGSEKKPVVTFVETDRKRQRGGTGPHKWVLNWTNAQTIAKLYGQELEGWPGKRITLYPTTCLAFGETKDCVRVRDTAPPPARAQQRKQPDPEPMPEDEEYLEEPPEDWQPEVQL